MQLSNVVPGAFLITAAVVTVSVQAQSQRPKDDGVYKSGVALVSVDATVEDSQGRIVDELGPGDFVVEEDDVPQQIVQFSVGHVPVSVVVALDMSASMASEKLTLAKQSLDAMLYTLFDPEDEFLLYGFSDRPVLLQNWTRDRSAIMLAADRMTPGGKTSLLDAVAAAVPDLQRIHARKTALVVMSDGNDNSSTVKMPRIKQLLESSATLVYAIGIGCGFRTTPARPARPHQASATPLPFRFPSCFDSLDAQALHQLTDFTGGRTEVVADPHDLQRATRGIATELTEQYDIGYAPTARRDGRWHSIRVTTRQPTLKVRARSGYLAK